jgi:hypothetical protein
MKARILIILLASGLGARGQAGRNTSALLVTSLNRSQWNAVEGLFQLTGNPNMFIRFTDKDGELVASFLWSDTEVHFLPESGLVFLRKEPGERGPVHIRFRKDGRGRVVHVTMGNGTEWAKSKVVVVTAAGLKAAEGKFRSIEDPDNQLEIIADDSGLVVKQIWDGMQTKVKPLSGTFYYNPTRYYTLQFMPGKVDTSMQIVLMGRYKFRFIGK